MTDNPGGQDLYRLSLDIKAALLRRDAATLNRLTRAYTMMYSRLKASIDALVLKIGDQPMTKGQITRLAQYNALIRDIEREVRSYGGFLQVELSQAARDNLAIASRDARVLVSSIAGGNRTIMAGWQTLNPEVTQTLLGFLDPRGKLFSWMAQGMPEGAAQRVADTIITAVGIGKNPRTVAALIRDDFGGVLTDALRTARTVQIRAYNEATRANYVANNDIVTGWIWASAADDRTCESCWAMHGTKHGLDETLDDHYQGRCYPGDSLVSGESVEALISRRYDGDLITISTSSGQLFSVTPDHPILTDNGWIVAKELQFGFNVINYTGEQRTSSSVRPNEYHGPTKIEDVARSLSMVWLGSVPGTSENFYGYRANPNINVINPNSFLRNNVVSAKPRTKNNFTCRLLAFLFSQIGAHDLLFLWHNSSPANRLGFQHPLALCLNGVMRSEQPISYQRSTDIDTGLSKPPDNYTTRDPQDFRKFVLRYPGLIKPDKIVNVDIKPFHGLVYNLQTKNRWYISSSIITHNCAMLPLTPFGPQSITVGEDRFKELSEPVQKSILGKGKWEAWSGGKFAFTDIPKQTDDEVYGSMRVAKSLKELVPEEE